MLNLTLDELISPENFLKLVTEKEMPFYALLVDALSKYRINNKKRISHFLAQTLYETQNYKRLSEDLNYSAQRLIAIWPKHFNKDNGEDYAHKPEKTANRAYADRMGNGTEQSGDGWKYKGRSLLMITGKENYYKIYRTIGNGIANNIVANPSLLEIPIKSVNIAAYWWEHIGCNMLADEDNINEITHKINGGTISLEDRIILLNKVRRVIN